MKKIPEVIMHYNAQDKRYYIYLGEDYVADTQNYDDAIIRFCIECDGLNDLVYFNTLENAKFSKQDLEDMNG